MGTEIKMRNPRMVMANSQYDDRVFSNKIIYLRVKLKVFLAFVISNRMLCCLCRQAESDGRKSKWKKYIQWRDHFQDLSSRPPNTLGHCQSFDPLFTFIGLKFIIFPSLTYFAKISLRSQVGQVPLSQQLRFLVMKLGVI